MNQPAHNTQWVNRTQTRRFYHFVSTGKERDEETGYGYFGARYMDHELMTMWLSVDPLADKYPSISPYAYCAWNPVKLVDPDGREIYYVFKGKEYFLRINKDASGHYSTNWVHTDELGNTETLKLSRNRPYIRELDKAFRKLLNGKEGEKLVMSVVSHKQKIEIKDGYRTSSSGKNGGINWNREDSSGPLRLSDGGNTIPNYIGLAHELAHIDDYLYDRCTDRDEEWDSYTDPVTNDKVTVPRAEGYACTIENKVRTEHDLPKRTWYYYKSREIKAGNVSTFKNR